MTGQPYEVSGVRYTPREDPHYDRVGMASWYGELFHGRRTANGEIYDMERLSAASPTLPLPVYVRVTNLANNRSLVLRVNDRGPYASSRIMDVSRRAAELLDFRSNGTTQVRVQYLGPAPLNGDDSYERQYAASQRWTHYASATSGQLPADPAAVGSLPKIAAPIAQADAPSFPATSQPINAAAVPTLRWRASAVAPARQVARNTRLSEQVPTKTEASRPDPGSAPSPAGLLIQAGSFKSKDNADRARSELAAIGPVDVAPIAVSGQPFFRVRVGPFASQAEATSALERVTGAGYAGAKLVPN